MVTNRQGHCANNPLRFAPTSVWRADPDRAQHSKMRPTLHSSPSSLQPLLLLLLLLPLLLFPFALFPTLANFFFLFSLTFFLYESTRRQAILTFQFGRRVQRLCPVLKLNPRAPPQLSQNPGQGCASSWCQNVTLVSILFLFLMCFAP